MALQSYYLNTSYFECTQPNPTECKGKVTKDDCTVRAFAIAARYTWHEAFDILCNKARELYDMPDSIETIKALFADMGYQRISLPAKKGEKRMTAQKFAESHPEGRYILNMAGHICAVVDGKIRDSWNCGEKCVYTYWEVEQ